MRVRYGGPASALKLHDGRTVKRGDEVDLDEATIAQLLARRHAVRAVDPHDVLPPAPPDSAEPTQRHEPTLPRNFVIAKR